MANIPAALVKRLEELERRANHVDEIGLEGCPRYLTIASP
jgi:hypothetical protein